MDNISVRDRYQRVPLEQLETFRVTLQDLLDSGIIGRLAVHMLQQFSSYDCVEFHKFNTQNSKAHLPNS